MNGGLRTPIRVGHLLWQDRQDPAAFSGMPWNMSKALERAGCEVVPVIVGAFPRSRGTGVFGRRGRSKLLDRFKDLGVMAQNRCDGVFPSRAVHRADKHARSAAVAAARSLDQVGCDVIFGSGMSMPLAYLKRCVPVIYATDATARLVIDTYPKMRALGRGRRVAMLNQETRAVGNADAIVVPSSYCRRSMIVDHGARADQVSVVALGANIVPDILIEIPTPAPVDRNLDLLLTAADPDRKQLPLAVEVSSELRSRGWHVRLHYVGPRHACCAADDVVWAGELRMGVPEDARRHRSLLKACHLAFLPSIGEMYGIAPIESAAFGRPAIVSDVGGLPSVVRDGVTGRVIPLQTPITGWADAIEAMVTRPERYAEFSQAAHQRYLKELNWDAWGHTVRGLAEELVSAGG